MKPLVVLLWLLAGTLFAQNRLGDDLQRAASRYEPAATAAPTEVEQLIESAREHLTARRYAEAIAALDKAAGVAFQSGATGRSFELSLTAAELLRAKGDLAEAAERFRLAAQTNPNDPRAVTAHYTACETLAATLAQATPEQLELYSQFLNEHIRSWPNAPTAESARWSQVKLLKQQQRWEDLLIGVSGISKGDKHYAESQSLLVAAHAGLLQRSPTPERFTAARADLEPLFILDGSQWTPEWSPTQRDAAYVLASAAAEQGKAGVGYAQELLAAAFRGRPAPAPEWHRRATSLLVVAALSVGEGNEAAKWIALAHQGPGDERQQLLISTRDRVAGVQPGRLSIRQEATRLEQSVLALQGETQSATPQRATALADAGRDDEAIRLYKQLAAQQPNDRGVQVAYAKLLAKSGKQENQQQAELAWRKIEARSQRSSADWFEARLARLRLLVELGKQEEARKLLAMTRLLAPEPSQAFRADFDEIARAID